MFKTLIRYGKIYAQYIALSSAVNMSFRTHFFLLILMDIFFFATALTGMHIIYEHIATIGPWNKDQFLFFLCFMLTVDNIHMTMFSIAFWELSLEIRTGAFDYTIMRPLNTVFATFFRFFRPSGVAGFAIIVSLLIHYGIKVGLSPLDWALLPVFIISALALLLVIEFIISVSMFWLYEGTGVNFLRMQLQHLSRWPDFLFTSLSRKILIFGLPILLIGSGPVHFLLDKERFWPLLGMFLAIAVGLGILSVLWRLALRRYDSASS